VASHEVVSVVKLLCHDSI